MAIKSANYYRELGEIKVEPRFLALKKITDYLKLQVSNINGKIGFSIRNLYNQKNHLSKEYLGNNIPNDPIIVIDKYSLRLVPNFLLRFYW